MHEKLSPTLPDIVLVTLAFIVAKLEVFRTKFFIHHSLHKPINNIKY